MNDASRRALRTLLQFIVAGGFTEVISTFVVDLDATQKLLVLALTQLVVTFAQNYLEDNTNAPAILKAPASQGQNPAPADGGGV